MARKKRRSGKPTDRAAKSSSTVDSKMTRAEDDEGVRGQANRRRGARLNAAAGSSRLDATTPDETNVERTKRAVPRPVAAASILLAVVAVACVATAISLAASLPDALRRDDLVARRTLFWILLVFGVLNAVLFLYIRRARRWARVTALVVYTLVALLEGMRLLSGSGSGASWLALVVAFAVITLLTRPATSRSFFAAPR